MSGFSPRNGMPRSNRNQYRRGRELCADASALPEPWRRFPGAIGGFQAWRFKRILNRCRVPAEPSCPGKLCALPTDVMAVYSACASRAIGNAYRSWLREEVARVEVAVLDHCTRAGRPIVLHGPDPPIDTPEEGGG